MVESKIEEIQKLQRPMTKEVIPLVGLTGYYRKFIPNIATIPVHLTDLTRKAQPCQVIWTSDCEEVFRKLKDLLCSAPVLQAPDFKKSFVLQTDASDRGVDVVLIQRDKDGKDGQVAYFSKNY